MKVEATRKQGHFIRDVYKFNADARNFRFLRRRACREPRATKAYGGPCSRTGAAMRHSFYRLIHRGTKPVPCDFIAFCQVLNPMTNHQARDPIIMALP